MVTSRTFARSIFTNLGTELETLITGQAAPEEKLDSLGQKNNATKIKGIIGFVDFESQYIRKMP